MSENKLHTPKFQIFVWSLFDFANTSFAIMIITVGYSLYFRNVVVGEGGKGDFYWGLAISISMLITAIVAPILGAASDFSHRRKRFLFGFTIISVICTALLSQIDAGMILPGMILLIFANVGFEGGIVFYDSFLPLLANKSNYGRVSGYGFAMGYLGSIAMLLIAMPLYANGFDQSNLPNVKLSFLIAAGMFLVFSIPLFVFLRDHRVHFNHKVSFLAAGFRRVKNSFTNSRLQKCCNFSFSIFIYNDGILTIIAFSSIFAQQSLGFQLNEIFILFALVQASAFIGSIGFGILTDKIGAKKTITITLLIWIFVVGCSYFVTTKMIYYSISMIAGISLGSSQASSRSLMARLTPKNMKQNFSIL